MWTIRIRKNLSKSFFHILSVFITCTENLFHHKNSFLYTKHFATVRTPLKKRTKNVTVTFLATPIHYPGTPPANDTKWRCQQKYCRYNLTTSRSLRREFVYVPIIISFYRLNISRATDESHVEVYGT